MRIHPSRYVVTVVENVAWEQFSKVFIEKNVEEEEEICQDFNDVSVVFFTALRNTKQKSFQRSSLVFSR